MFTAKNSTPQMKHINRIQQNRKHETYFISWQWQNQIIEYTSIQGCLSIKVMKKFSILINSTFDASCTEEISFVSEYFFLNYLLLY